MNYYQALQQMRSSDMGTRTMGRQTIQAMRSNFRFNNLATAASLTAGGFGGAVGGAIGGTVSGGIWGNGGGNQSVWGRPTLDRIGTNNIPGYLGNLNKGLQTIAGIFGVMGYGAQVISGIGSLFGIGNGTAAPNDNYSRTAYGNDGFYGNASAGAVSGPFRPGALANLYAQNRGGVNPFGGSMQMMGGFDAAGMGGTMPMQLPIGYQDEAYGDLELLVEKFNREKGADSAVLARDNQGRQTISFKNSALENKFFGRGYGDEFRELLKRKSGTERGEAGTGTRAAGLSSDTRDEALATIDALSSDDIATRVALKHLKIKVQNGTISELSASTNNRSKEIVKKLLDSKLSDAEKAEIVKTLVTLGIKQETIVGLASDANKPKINAALTSSGTAAAGAAKVEAGESEVKDELSALRKTLRDSRLRITDRTSPTSDYKKLLALIETSSKKAGELSDEDEAEIIKLTDKILENPDNKLTPAEKLSIKAALNSLTGETTTSGAAPSAAEVTPTDKAKADLKKTLEGLIETADEADNINDTIKTILEDIKTRKEMFKADDQNINFLFGSGAIPQEEVEDLKRKFEAAGLIINTTTTPAPKPAAAEAPAVVPTSTTKPAASAPASTEIPHDKALTTIKGEMIKIDNQVSSSKDKVRDLESIEEPDESQRQLVELYKSKIEILEKKKNSLQVQERFVLELKAKESPLGRAKFQASITTINTQFDTTLSDVNKKIEAIEVYESLQAKNNESISALKNELKDLGSNDQLSDAQKDQIKKRLNTILEQRESTKNMSSNDKVQKIEALKKLDGLERRLREEINRIK